MEKEKNSLPVRKWPAEEPAIKRLQSSQSTYALLSEQIQPDLVVQKFKIILKDEEQKNKTTDITDDRARLWLEQVGFQVVATFEKAQEYHKKEQKEGGPTGGPRNFCLRVRPRLLRKMQVLLQPNHVGKATINDRDHPRLVQAAVNIVLESAKGKGFIGFSSIQFLHNKTKFDQLRASFKYQGTWMWSKNIEPFVGYFGSRTAFYFSWLRFYFMALLLPAGVGVLVWDPRSSDTLLVPLYVVFISLWSVGYLEMWRRKSNLLAYEWGIWRCKEDNQWQVHASESKAVCEKLHVDPSTLPGVAYASSEPLEGYSSLHHIINQQESEKTEDLEELDDWLGEDCLEQAFQVGDEVNYYSVEGKTPVKVKVAAVMSPDGVPGYAVLLPDGTEKSVTQDSLLPLAVGSSLWTSEMSGFGTEAMERPSSVVTGDDGESNAKEDQMEEMAYHCRLGFSYFVQFLFLAITIKAMLVFQYYELHNNQLFGEESLLRFGPAIAHSLTTMILAQIHTRVAKWLQKFEAVPDVTPEEYDSRLVLKLFGFQFVNFYCALFYSAFWEQDMAQVNTYLFSALVTRQLVSTLKEMLLPLVMISVKEDILHKSYIVEMANDDDPVKECILKKQLDEELNLGEAPTNGDYLEMVIQFGYVVMFSAAFKLAALLALVNNLFEFLIDSTNLLYHAKRPEYRHALSVGPWQYIMEFLGVVGVMTNCGFLLLTSTALEAYIPPLLSNAGGEDSKWQVGTLLMLIIVEHLLLLSRVFFAKVVEDVPKRVLRKNNAPKWRAQLRALEILKSHHSGSKKKLKVEI